MTLEALCSRFPLVGKFLLTSSHIPGEYVPLSHPVLFSQETAGPICSCALKAVYY